MKIAITQNFYDQMASQYDKLFQNWGETTKEQAALLDNIFKRVIYKNIYNFCYT